MTAPTIDELSAGVGRLAAEALFDSLPAVAAGDLRGRWRGAEVPTGHPMDGLLEISGWYGKQFDDADHVHPLLFGRPGSLYPVNPKLIPIPLLGSIAPKLPKRPIPRSSAALRPLRTRRHRARLRSVEYRGTVSAAMIYDDLPIIDHFRRLRPDTLLGAMDLRNSPTPYFFTLTQD
ncbi:DUF4334 domain-containing protein [Gordonia neofelifaecis]|uniref:DUF4334 domain-containing protein n=1 Tax=Gordonia neofelifaecis NRRL B-59395 TaxID=644548 RepID=F1YNX6_9ACTN|nr:DUF4334 domain-containing protein [Gordonia neofelifaecis]EGD53595.1 hypothetical protein SCNU_18127 [Gordonia neofelifaecis NRRL B-59395]